MIKTFIVRLLQRSPVARFALAPTLFLLFFGLTAFIANLAHRNPVLNAIIPAIGESGEVVVIQGRHFGDDKDSGWIEIAGNRLSGTAYISWSDTNIMAILPVTVEDGLVYVCRGNKRSNPLIFANRKNIPVTARVGNNAGIPEIAAFDALRAETGKKLVIRGRNFGISRENSEVLFAWKTDDAIPIAAKDRAEKASVSCSDQNFDYEFWSDQEIRVRVPDGATTGPVFVRTARGLSNDMSVEITGQPGTKTYGPGRTFVISQQVDITGMHASEGGMIFLRIPLPITTPSQRDVEVTASEPKPYIANHRGTVLHQLEGLRTGKTEKVAHSFVCTSYGISTQVNPAQVRPYSDRESPLYLFYTQADPLVPADSPDVRIAAAEIMGKERNPWRAAKLAYDWLTGEFTYEDRVPQERTALDALKRKEGSAYDMAILFCALARASGIPAVPLAGIIVDANRDSRVHWWAEFYVEGLGWIPVDPALGKGKPLALREENAREWYFGNLDPYHVAFSRGWTEQKPMTPKSKVVFRPRSWAFQSLWEESAGNVKGYTSFWGEPRVTGVY